MTLRDDNEVIRNDRADLRAHVKEGLEALEAFEQFCREYPKHELSPRLNQWREKAERLMEIVRA